MTSLLPDSKGQPMEDLVHEPEASSLVIESTEDDPRVGVTVRVEVSATVARLAVKALASPPFTSLLQPSSV